MLFFQLEKDGTLPDEIREMYGGAFPFWEQVKMGGTGSHKLQLLDGPGDVMEWKAPFSETLQVSFQYLKNAFLIRYNVVQRLQAHIIPYGEIQSCTLYRKEPIDEEEVPMVEIVTNEGIFRLLPHPSDYLHFKEYLSKKPLKEVYQEYEFSIQP